MEGIEIERVGPEDWERFRAVRLRALEDSPDAFGTLLAEDEARPLGDWRTRLGIAENANFLAAGAGGDVGIVVGTPWRWDTDVRAAGLFAMWVAPQARGNGVGGALVDAVIAWAKVGGFERLILDVADANAAAIALYASRGFVPTGKTGTLDPPREHVLEHERALDLTGT